LNPCKVCDADNPNGLLLCKVCKAPLTQTNPSYEQPLLTKPKMAVVNIDRALLDNTNFETDRKAKRLKKGSAEHTRMITEKLEMQTVSPEAKQFLDSLVDQGLVIGFISEKHQGHMSRQKNHLQNLGLPIMIDSSGVLLKSGSDSKILNDWGSRYDIQYYFGDAVKTARKKGIPGTYDTVNGYIGAPIKNPAIMMEETPAPYALVNPPPKPRTKKMKNGKSRREPVKSYINRFMKSKKQVADFPDRRQRYAVGMTYAEKFYGRKIYSNPPMGKDAYGGDIMVESEEARDLAAILKAQAEAAFIEKFGTDMAGLTGSPPSRAPVSSGSLISQLPPYEEVARERASTKKLEDLGSLFGDPTESTDPIKDGKITGHGYQLFIDQFGEDEVPNIGQYDLKDRSFGAGSIFGPSWKWEKRISAAPPPPPPPSGKFRSIPKILGGDWDAEAERQLFIDQFGEDEIPNMHNYSFMPADSSGPAYWTKNIFRTKKKSSSSQKSPLVNPSSKTKKKKSKKVKAAEKAYKDFHGGKKPKKVETVSVEFSDVWYCLGPVWCIGYMSDKEGFGEQQKYIHHTNEESKDGDFPMLYATMPESGEQMFMIKGGTMKVSARDGLDWLID